MHTLTRLIGIHRQTAVALLFGWFVVTFGGQAVAGPFTLLSDCTTLAKVMAAKYPTVSTVCQPR